MCVGVPRDRDDSFDTIRIPKHTERFTGFDKRIIALYSRGMRVREIQVFLAEMYRTEVLPSLISSMTGEIIALQNRLLHVLHPVVLFDALRVKILCQLGGRQ